MPHQNHHPSERRRRSDTSGILQHESSMLVLVVGHQSLSNLHFVCLYLVLHYLLKQKQKQNNNMTGKTEVAPTVLAPSL